MLALTLAKKCANPNYTQNFVYYEENNNDSDDNCNEDNTICDCYYGYDVNVLENGDNYYDDNVNNFNDITDKNGNDKCSEYNEKAYTQKMICFFTYFLCTFIHVADII